MGTRIMGNKEDGGIVGETGPTGLISGPRGGPKFKTGMEEHYGLTY